MPGLPLPISPRGQYAISFLRLSMCRQPQRAPQRRRVGVTKCFKPPRQAVEKPVGKERRDDGDGRWKRQGRHKKNGPQKPGHSHPGLKAVSTLTNRAAGQKPADAHPSLFLL